MRGPSFVIFRVPVPRVWPGVGLAAAAALFTACGGGESGTSPSLPSRTGTAQPSVTASVPSPTRTLPDRSTTPAETSPPAETSTPTRTETTTQTATRTTTQTPTEEPAPAAGSNSSHAEKTTSDATDAPAWLWWLLAAVLVVCAVAIPLLVRARRRRAWDADLAAAEHEVEWFVRVLLPELQQAGSATEVRGGWGVGEARVAAVEDQLTALAATGRDDAGTARAVALRDAVRLSRERIRNLATSGPADISRDLAAVSADLATALGPMPSAELAESTMSFT